MIDGAGAIYVIGGFGGGTVYYNDVWASIDGGAWPDYVRGVVGGYAGWVLRRYLGGATGVHRGYLVGTGGTQGVLRGYNAVTKARTIAERRRSTGVLGG